MAVAKNKIVKNKMVNLHFSPRKLKALQELSKLNLKLSSGYEYGLHKKIIPGITLKEVRKSLSKIKGSMSSFVCKEREEN